MSIQFLDWDSNFFNLNISKLDVLDVFINKANLDFTTNDLIYVFSNIRQHDLEKDGGKLVDVKITYEKPIVEKTEDNFPEISSYSENVNDELFKLGIASGWASRFNIDPRLKDKFVELYELWVTNSVARIIADEIYVVKDNGHFIGLMTLKQIGQTGKIGIIAVDENHRGKEFGKKLLRYADKWYFDKGITQALVVTQQLNTNACKFYEKNGYSIRSIEYIYHVWK